MKLSPSLAHFVWLGHPLTGGNTSGPAEPVPRCFPKGARFARRGLRGGIDSKGASGRLSFWKTKNRQNGDA